MHTAGRVLRLFMLGILLSLTAPFASITSATTTSSHHPSGITVAPAALQLSLQKGQKQTNISFAITNGYSGPVTLSFSLEKPTTSTQAADNNVRPEVFVANPLVTIPAGASVSQTITLHDTLSLEPGSRQMDMVISGQGSSSGGVGVLPGLRLPVTLIKYDGAIASLGSASITGSRVFTTIPKQVTLNLKNTGNMTVIPRGTVRVVSPKGAVLGKGTLNESSKAIAPGGEIQLTTAVTQLTSAATPGNYRIIADYGLGGNNPTQHVATTFIYASWWHLLTLAGAAGAGLALYVYGRRWHARRKVKQGQKTPKRQLLIGRDIA